MFSVQEARGPSKAGCFLQVGHVFMSAKNFYNILRWQDAAVVSVSDVAAMGSYVGPYQEKTESFSVLINALISPQKT